MASFTQLLDRGLPSDSALAAWCPTMDLLALASADGQLHVHRLNWQRLWWTSPEAPITGDSTGQGMGRRPCSSWSEATSRQCLAPALLQQAASPRPALQPWSGVLTASSWQWGWRMVLCCC